METLAGSRAAYLAAGTLSLLLAACSHLPHMHMPSAHWPWHHHAAPPPEPVNELVITQRGAPSTSFPQYWKRNTLLVDLRAASGEGAVALRPREGTSWPVRLAFRVWPGTIGILEVRADQRVLLPITPGATKPVDLELAPGVYTLKTEEITLSWAPAPVPVPVHAPAPTT